MCFALTVFFNFLYAPFVTGFPAFRETYISSLKVVEYSIEFFWACSIFVNFMLASTEMKIFTFKESAKRYLATYGIPDILASIGSIYIILSDSKESDGAAIVLFIRFTHFPSLFYPVKFYLRNYTDMNKKRERQILLLFYAFFLLIFFSHIFACFLVLFGYVADDEELNKQRWIYVNAEGGLWGDHGGVYVTAENDPVKVFMFSYYWVWEVITTVGYGDRSIPISNDNLGDVSFTLFIEFVGVLMQAVVINVMTAFASTEYSFTALVNEKLEPL